MLTDPHTLWTVELKFSSEDRETQPSRVVAYTQKLRREVNFRHVVEPLNLLILMVEVVFILPLLFFSCFLGCCVLG